MDKPFRETYWIRPESSVGKEACFKGMTTSTEESCSYLLHIPHAHLVKVCELELPIRIAQDAGLLVVISVVVAGHWRKQK